MSDLLPCPICGEDGAYHVHSEMPDSHIAGCSDPDCIAHQLAYDFMSRESAITAWNTRAPSSPEIGERVDLAERLREMVRTDHLRGCKGREYECSCGHTDRQDALLLEAADALATPTMDREAVARIIDPWAFERAECDPETEDLRAEAYAKADAILALSAPSPSADALRPGEALTTMLCEAVRFASWAAGEGICPADGQPARAPDDFLMDYSDATGEEDWETMADRLPGLLVPLPPAGGRE